MCVGTQSLLKVEGTGADREAWDVHVCVCVCMLYL